MQTYQLVDYFDVCGNEEDGYEINNLCRVEGIEIELEYESDKQMIQALVDVDFLKPEAIDKVEVRAGDDHFIEFDELDTGRPICRLEAI